MKAVDTNVLARFLVADDPEQSARVRRCLERAERDRDHLFVSIPVTLELLWVLRSVYEVPRSEIIEALAGLLDLSCLRFEAADRLRAMTEEARFSGLDLADLLIALTAREFGCEATLTLDRKASRDARFELLGDSCAGE